MSLRKILILFAPCGAGHKKAAEALAAYFNEQPGVMVELKDVLEFAPAWYRLIYRDGYYALIRKFPSLWYLLYQGTEFGNKENIPTRTIRKIEDSFLGLFTYI